MGLKIAVLKETNSFERRVAATPDTVKKICNLGCSVLIEAGAGLEASFSDEAYTNAGAKITKTTTETLKNADVVLKVQAPDVEQIKTMKERTIVMALFNPHKNVDIIKACAKADIQAFAMELVPRITRAQSMDVLSSQSNLAGYKAVLDAAGEFTRAFPMMMTAAGTVPPAKVFIMGAGVAGLQAIATAKRLGAIVNATDVRPAAKEQVESLGGSFVAVEDEEFTQAETAGGYAKEMSKEYQKKQQALVEKTIAKQDIVIATALIPGRPAPKLITKTMVESMKPGSVIVDLAVENGGNCALSVLGKIVNHKGVKIIGHNNVPSRLATDASALYARNLLNLLNLIIDPDKGILEINPDDDIIQGISLTRGGNIIHPEFQQKQPSKKVSEKKPTAKKAKGA